MQCEVSQQDSLQNISRDWSRALQRDDIVCLAYVALQQAVVCLAFKHAYPFLNEPRQQKYDDLQKENEVLLYGSVRRCATCCLNLLRWLRGFEAGGGLEGAHKQ